MFIYAFQDPVELPKTQDRPSARATDSDIYFKSLLASKLASHNSSIAQTRPKNGKFNLPGLLGNAVYPAECPDDEDHSILNASCLPSLLQSKTGVSNELSFLNETEVDEDIIQTTSQRQAQDQDETSK